MYPVILFFAYFLHYIVQLSNCNSWFSSCRILYTVMIGLVLQLHGCLKTIICNMASIKLGLSSRFITLNLEPPSSPRRWHTVTRLLLSVLLQSSLYKLLVPNYLMAERNNFLRFQEKSKYLRSFSRKQISEIFQLERKEQIDTPKVSEQTINPLRFTERRNSSPQIQKDKSTPR